jgi:hypothetical protein
MPAKYKNKAAGLQDFEGQQVHWWALSWRGREKGTMGYENLTPALERIKVVSGFIASKGQDTKTVFAWKTTIATRRR